MKCILKPFLGILFKVYFKIMTEFRVKRFRDSYIEAFTTSIYTFTLVRILADLCRPGDFLFDFHVDLGPDWLILFLATKKNS